MAGMGYYEEGDELSEEENFELDDNLSALERLKKYKGSHLLLQRLRIAKELGDIAQQLGYQQTTEHMIDVLQEFAYDTEGVILQALAEQLPFFANFFIEHGGEEGMELVVNVLLSFVSTLIMDDHHQVREATCKSFKEISRKLSKEQQLKHVVPIISKLAKNTVEEEHRIEAAELLNSMAEVLEEDILKTFGIEQIITLSKDPMFRVRKAIAATLGTVSCLVGEEIVTNSLLPIFLQLTKDEIWGVKKACAESIVLLSRSTTPEARLNKLSPVYEELIKDPSRWVRNSMYQNLGPFIATLTSDTVSPQLLQYYISMIEGAKNQYGDSDTVSYCAYSFPGVLLTLGKEKWDVLQNVYFTLTQDLQWKVRRTLSHSLHEVAKILGTETTEQALLQTFEMFLKDLDQVKVGVIRHLAKFLRVLSEKTRQEYVETILEIQTHGTNWRFRKLLAKQLGDIAELYNAETVESAIIPLAIQLCEDQVTTVRYAVTSQLGVLLKQLTEMSPDLANSFIEKIRIFGTRESCYDRQTFSMICENLVGYIEPSVFLENFYPELRKQVHDRVPNIRFVVARIFSQKLYRNEDYPEDIRKEIGGLLEEMSKDQDREVQFFCRVATPK